MIDKNFLYTVNSIVNYYTNADSSTPITIKKTGKNVLQKIKSMLDEDDFFEEWGVYESDMPMHFSDEEKKIIYQLIEKAKKDYLKNDVDITTILDPEDFSDIKIDLFVKAEENRSNLSSETPHGQEKESVEKWLAYWEKVNFESRKGVAPL